MGTHKAFPGLVETSSGLLLAYRDGVAHGVRTGADRGILRQHTSTDGGCTWSAASVLHDEGDRDSRDCCLTRLAVGTLVCSFFYSGNGSSAAQVVTSADDGANWSSAVAVGSSAFTLYNACSGPVVELPNGDLLLAMYGKATGDTFNSCLVSKSTDGGATWADLATIADGEGIGDNFTEPNLVRLANGNLFCFLRHDGDISVWSSLSTDDGATWSAPSSEGFLGSGRPAGLLASNGALISTYRRSALAGFRVSWDSGANWSIEGTIDVSSSAVVYAQLQEVGTSKKVATVYAMETSDTASDVYFTYLHPREVADPLAACA